MSNVPFPPEEKAHVHRRTGEALLGGVLCSPTASLWRENRRHRREARPEEERGPSVVLQSEAEAETNEVCRFAETNGFGHARLLYGLHDGLDGLHGFRPHAHARPHAGPVVAGRPAPPTASHSPFVALRAIAHLGCGRERGGRRGREWAVPLCRLLARPGRRRRQVALGGGAMGGRRRQVGVHER